MEVRGKKFEQRRPEATQTSVSARDRLCAVLAGPTSGALDRDPPWPASDADAVIALARAERLDAVLAYRLRDTDASRAWPAGARAVLADHLRQQLVLESMRHRELVRVLQAFADAGVDALLLKGAGLAYTVYAQPHLRPRDDTDVFIQRVDLDRAGQALAACGYGRTEEADVEIASTQRHYTATDAAGLRHLVDLHWRVAIPHVFADALAFDEAWSRAIAVPALGASARTCGLADGLLVACIHRVAHHRDTPDLMWLWDIHLLAGSLTREEHARFAAAAARARMCTVCLRGLGLAHERFGTRIDEIAAAVEAARSGTEPSARFVGGLRLIDVLRTDLQSLHGRRERLRLLREHLFPPTDYMRALFGPRAFLPFAYLRRIVRGAPAWFKRPRSGA